MLGAQLSVMITNMSNKAAETYKQSHKVKYTWTYGNATTYSCLYVLKDYRCRV